jgi:hypothetical protein
MVFHIYYASLFIKCQKPQATKWARSGAHFIIKLKEKFYFRHK